MSHSEDDLERQAKRLFPHIREQLHTDDELASLAKKLKPHNDDLDAQAVGHFFLEGAKRLLRKALWTLGAGVLAAFAYFKGTGK